jgi:ethanolamine transporter
LNIFIAVMLSFAALGLLDEILGGKLDLAGDFEKGVATMGSLTMSTVGLYVIGVSFIQSHAAAIAAAAEHMPFDPSVLVSCLLAPDMGALPISLEIASGERTAAFSGAMIAGGLGATVGFQLPVFLASVKKEEIPDLMLGFIFGILPLPAGLLAGGMMIGMPLPAILVNMLPVIIVCAVLILAFFAAPRATQRVMIILGTIIRIFSYLFSGLAMASVFLPELIPLDQALVREILVMVLRMMCIASGGLVLSHLALTRGKHLVSKAANLLGVNNEAVVGLILTLTQSLAMLPLYSRMDRRGQIINAAFSVAAAYVIGGQFAFVSSLIPEAWIPAYMANKLLDGVLGILIAVLVLRRNGKGKEARASD